MSLHSQRLTQIAMGSSSDLCFGDWTLSILDLSHSTAVGQHFHDAILRGVEESPRLQERHSSEIVLQLHSFNLCLALQCSRRHENGLLIFTLNRHGTVSTQNKGVDSLNFAIRVRVINGQSGQPLTLPCVVHSKCRPGICCIDSPPLAGTHHGSGTGERQGQKGGSPSSPLENLFKITFPNRRKHATNLTLPLPPQTKPILQHLIAGVRTSSSSRRR